MNASSAFLDGLVDYAGLFPPESRDMPGAVAGYREARDLHPGMLGRFICPERRLEQLADLIGDESDPWPLSVIVSPREDDWSRGIADRAVSMRVVRDAMWSVAHFEMAEATVPADIAGQPALAAVLASARTSLEDLFDILVFEVPLPSGSQEIESFVAAAAEAAVGAKLRTGGETPAAVPSPRDVARFIAACVDAELHFKATAGLHHPIRHFDSGLGARRHGFMNVIGAGILAVVHGLDVETIEKIVAEEDTWAFELSPDRFRWRELAADADQIGEARATTVLSYGSCSFTEPLADLREMQVL